MGELMMEKMFIGYFRDSIEINLISFNIWCLLKIIEIVILLIV